MLYRAVADYRCYQCYRELESSVLSGEIGRTLSALSHPPLTKTLLSSGWYLSAKMRVT